MWKLILSSVINVTNTKTTLVYSDSILSNGISGNTGKYNKEGFLGASDIYTIGML